MKNTKRMDTGLFHKIIDELAALGWSGEIAPNFYGEPLLDDRMVELVKYARNKINGSMITLFTNGDFLTVELYLRLVKAGVSAFCITEHPDGTPPFINEILEYRKAHGDDHVKVEYKKLTMIYSREGDVPIDEVAPKDCANAAYRKIGIDWDGNVVFCCNDYFVTVKLGNVRKERLIDVWRKPYYKKLRKKLYRGQSKLEICRKCKYGTVAKKTLSLP